LTFTSGDSFSTLHRLRGGVGLLAGFFGFPLELVDLARQLLDLPLLLADDVHQLGIALRRAGVGRQEQNRGCASRREAACRPI
jgi:hypothetical protein